VEHPLVKKISFTVGTVTGRTVAHVTADKIMLVSLELGGKSPTIIFDDADMALAIRGVLYGIVSSQGQACIAGSRLFVQRSCYDDVVARLLQAVTRIRIGDPRSTRATSGSTPTSSSPPRRPSAASNRAGSREKGRTWIHEYMSPKEHVLVHEYFPNPMDRRVCPRFG